MIGKGEGVHVCVLCVYVAYKHGRNSLGLVPSTTWARLASSMALASSPPYPSPCFPTLSIHQTPARRPRFPQLSQRTSWYSQAPAVEKRTLRPVDLRVFPLNIPCRGAQESKCFKKQTLTPLALFSESLPIFSSTQSDSGAVIM